MPLADLPGDIAARLSAQGEVLDLSQHLETLVALAERRPPKPQVRRALNLPDATDELAERLHVGIDWLQDCVDLLRDRRQLIFYGPPGTGKTYIAQELARHVTDQGERQAGPVPSGLLLRGLLRGIPAAGRGRRPDRLHPEGRAAAVAGRQGRGEPGRGLRPHHRRDQPRQPAEDLRRAVLPAGVPRPGDRP